MSDRNDDYLTDSGRAVMVVAELQKQNAALLKALRAIELAVDGLNTKAFKQRPVTQEALDRIKSHARAAIQQAESGS